MADKKPETKPPEEKAPEKPSGPTPEQLYAAAQQAEIRARTAENRAAYAEQIAREASSRASQPPTQGPVDPLIRYSQEDITMSPDEKRAHLAAAMEGRARQAAAQSEQRFEQRLQQEAVATEARTAINTVTMRRPELSEPKNSANFAAAMTRAKYEANAAGYDPTPTQLVIAAEKAYDEIFRKTEKPPFTESPSAGALAETQIPPGKPERSPLEQRYKMKPGMIQPMYDISDAAAMNAFNNDYVISRMKPQLDNGLNSDYANLLNAAIEEKG